MGWKASLLIIENKRNFKDEVTLLQAIGLGHYSFEKTVTLDECIYPSDRSINIGYYNGNIIISDDFQITKSTLEEDTCEENQLMERFTFGIAKRRLGVLLDYEDGQELMENIVFRKYINAANSLKAEIKTPVVKNNRWIKYVVIFIIGLFWQILKRTVFKGE